ncbi:MAG TPA: hypothetical protein VMO20_08480 [Candidatus Acidoferrum sp.]|nr:hypothetical protein [Candidatus Acidoferrum sp.]
MKKAEAKNFGKPDEVREFPKGKVEVVNEPVIVVDFQGMIDYAKSL